MPRNQRLTCFTCQKSVSLSDEAYDALWESFGTDCNDVVGEVVKCCKEPCFLWDTKVEDISDKILDHISHRKEGI